MNRDLTQGPVTRSMLLFAIPMILGDLLQQCYNIADTLIVGQFLGRDALAAVGSSFTLMTFLTSIILGLCMGSGALFSIRFGQRDETALRGDLCASFFFIAFVTALLNILAFVCLDALRTFLRVPAEVWGDMRESLFVIFMGIPAVLLYNYFASFLRAIGNSVIPLGFLAVSAVLNIALDLWFVIGLNRGVAGAAEATVIAQYVSGIGIAVFTLARFPQVRSIWKLRCLRRGRRDRRGPQRSYPRAVRRRTVAHLRAVCRGRREGPRSPRGGDEMTVGIVGLGLIGGSFAKAYHAAGWRVLGYDRDESVLSFTQLADAVDEPLTMGNIGTCELVLLCVRPLAAVEYLRQAAPHIGGKPVVIDCCGTKRVVCAAAFPLAKEYGFTYLGGHPMAGTQYSGFGHARANLYHNAPMVIVPPDFDNIELLSRVKELLSPAGFGSFSVTTADSHDEMIAFTSQMAHLVSNAYIKSPTAKAHKGFSAGSYKDMTRVAWLNAPMWSELFLENRDYMLRELDGLMDCLMQYRAAIAENDGEALTQLLEEGKKRKEEVDGR